MKTPVQGITIHAQGLSQGVDPASSLALDIAASLSSLICEMGVFHVALKSSSNKYISSPVFKLLGVPCFWEVL